MQIFGVVDNLLITQVLRLKAFFGDAKDTAETDVIFCRYLSTLSQAEDYGS